MYISITGIKYKGLFQDLRFWINTIPSFIDAKKANGNIFCDQKKIEDYHHTLTAWKDKTYMLNYIKGKAHSKAMKNFKLIGTGSTFGYESDQIPNWDEALNKWKENFKQI